MPFGLLALLTFRAADLWRTGELDPITLALVPVAAAMVVWLVRQPGACGGADCAVPGVDEQAEDGRVGGEVHAHDGNDGEDGEEPVAPRRDERAPADR